MPVITTEFPLDNWTLGRKVTVITFVAPDSVELSEIVRVVQVETPAPSTEADIATGAIVVPLDAAIVGVTAA